MSIRQRFQRELSQLNPAMVWAIAFLGVIGCAMMFSASGGHLQPWAIRQVPRFVFGFVLMLGVALIPQERLMRYAYVFYALCLAMLLVVMVAGFMGKGAQRWVDLGVVNLQPSELMKIALVMALARYFHTLPPRAIHRPLFLIPPALLLLVPAALILKQPNLGTATILCLVGAGIFFFAGVQLRYFIALGILVLAALPVGWHVMHDYQKQRVLTFLSPEADPLGAGYNIMQSMIAIGSGGFFGKGYIQGSQGQLDFLPEKQTDFIFTMFAEEFGFFGALVLLACYGFLLFYGTGIAMRSRSRFCSLLAIGITLMLFAHVWINMAMVMGLIPVVGVPLPMLSYGGSFLITMLLGFGLLLNAFMHRNRSLHRNTGAGLL